MVADHSLTAVSGSRNTPTSRSAHAPPQQGVAGFEVLTIARQFCSADSRPSTSLVQLLGYAIIAGACYVKVPQILGINRAKSAEGLSASSFELEQVGLAIHSTYGFIMGLPFTAFGEAIVMLLQNTLLLCQVYYYTRASTIRPVVMVALLAGLGFYVTSGVILRKVMIISIHLSTKICLIEQSLAQDYVQISN